jgi:hypothetical protein
VIRLKDTMTRSVRASSPWRVLIAALVLLLTSCTWRSHSHPKPPGSVSSPSPGQTESIFDLAAFVGALENQGLSVKVVPETSESFFSGHASGVRVGKRLVRVIEYRSAALMQREAAGVSPDGYQVQSERSDVMVEWVAPPHFFKRGRVIVLFLGKDPSLISAIQSVLGPQFAGS